jgi:hypothetical protein
MNKEREGEEPTLFDEMNAYLKKEAPKDIEKPTVEGIAERMGIPEDTLNFWLANDQQFKEELTRLKDFQINDPFKEGTEFDYFIHSSGVQFVLDETKKRYTL